MWKSDVGTSHKSNFDDMVVMRFGDKQLVDASRPYYPELDMRMKHTSLLNSKNV